MSKPIQELYNQSLKTVFDYGGTEAKPGEMYNNYKTVLDYEKFAQLIVQEVFTRIENEGFEIYEPVVENVKNILELTWKSDRNKMKLIELFLDRFTESTIFEMARSRADAKDKITELSPEIIDHLIKLFVFNSPENKSHWVNEINTWLWSIDKIRLKPSNKKPDWQTIYNWMIYDSSPHYNADYVDTLVKRLLTTGYLRVTVHDYDAETVLNQVLKIIEAVCKDISVPNKFVSINQYLE